MTTFLFLLFGLAVLLSVLCSRLYQRLAESEKDRVRLLHQDANNYWARWDAGYHTGWDAAERTYGPK